MQYIKKEELIKAIRRECPYEDTIDKSTLIYNILEEAENIEVSKLTDAEQRILLSAISREKKVCEEVDKTPGEVDLVAICNSIEQKIKEALF